MDFQTAVRTCLAKYATFSGRAARSEFWWFVLFNVLANFALGLIDTAIFGTAPDSAAIFAPLFSLAMLIPNIAVAVRRLHDTDRSGWWYLLILIPLIGIIVLIVWWATPGTRGPNRFGPDPLDGPDTGAAYRDSSVPHVGRGDQ